MTEASMAKTSPFVPVALVVEDDEMQRELVAMLLQESEMGVIQCENAEAALDVLEKMGALLSMMFTDVNLSGHIDGVELAHFTHQHYPNINVIVTSGRALTKELPDGATFMPKPWMALDLLREAERSQN
jgi:DNA-binding NtrC family response regulator